MERPPSRDGAGSRDRAGSRGRQRGREERGAGGQSGRKRTPYFDFKLSDEQAWDAENGRWTERPTDLKLWRSLHMPAAKLQQQAGGRADGAGRSQPSASRGSNEAGATGAGAKAGAGAGGAGAAWSPRARGAQGERANAHGRGSGLGPASPAAKKAGRQEQGRGEGAGDAAHVAEARAARLALPPTPDGDGPPLSRTRRPEVEHEPEGAHGGRMVSCCVGPSEPMDGRGAGHDGEARPLLPAMARADEQKLATAQDMSFVAHRMVEVGAAAVCQVCRIRAASYCDCRCAIMPLRVCLLTAAAQPCRGFTCSGSRAVVAPAHVEPILHTTHTTQICSCKP